MTNSLRHIIICLLALPLFMGCRDEESSLPAEGQRTITLNLGITTRATDGTDIGDDSQPDNMQLWIFDDNANAPECLFYQNYTSPTFSGSDALGELVHTLEEVIDVANDIRTLNFYIVMNGQNATGLTLNDASTPTDIENATFSGLQQTGAGQNIRDNQVPIYGHATLSVNDPRKQHYSLRIETKRAVGKLELFFTKESEGAYLRINSIKLEQMPDIGYLKYAQESETQSVATNFTGSVANILSRTPQVVDQFLPEASASIGSFSDHESSFTRLALTHTYLLENLRGDTWAALDNHKDFTYPYDETSTSITDENTRYKMTVAYQTSETGEAKEQVVYLPKMERNTWNKIYARVKGGTLVLQYRAMPWDVVTTSIGYAPEHIATDGNPFATDASNNVAWESSTVANGNYYALFPINSYNTTSSGNNSRNTTTKLMRWLYNNPDGGDNEARLCILTRPTYDDQVDDNKHWALKAGSAGAQYMFILTGPEGATWEAHLTNEEDFSFSTTEEDDFNHSEYESEGKVYKVTHGIARQKPYIIQVIADHLYTGYEEGLSGETTEGSDYDGNGYNQYSGNSADEWEPLFGKNYLTDWGKQKWNNREVVETELYITVRLADGTEYELTINPSYTDSNLASRRFPFKEKRRFAGTDTRIWIRHVRAQHNWPNLEYMAWDCKDAQDYNDDNRIEDYEQPHWWTVNPYWNPDHEWKD